MVRLSRSYYVISTTMSETRNTVTVTIIEITEVMAEVII